jgi:hypothetical protein
VALLVLSGAFFKLMKDYLSVRNEYSTAAIDASKVYVRKAGTGHHSRIHLLKK